MFRSRPDDLNPACDVAMMLVLDESCAVSRHPRTIALCRYSRVCSIGRRNVHCWMAETKSVQEVQMNNEITGGVPSLPFKIFMKGLEDVFGLDKSVTPFLMSMAEINNNQLNIYLHGLGRV